MHISTLQKYTFFQRTKTTKLKVKVNVFAAQVHVKDLVVAHIEQNLTMYYAKLEWDRGGKAQRSGDRCPYLGEHGGGPHRAKPAHVQRQTGVSWWWRGIRWRSTTFWRWLPWPRELVGALEQPSMICIPTYRHFENPFENAHWGKVRQMQPVRLCFLLYKRFEQTFDNTQWPRKE